MYIFIVIAEKLKCLKPTPLSQTQKLQTGSQKQVPGKN